MKLLKKINFIFTIILNLSIFFTYALGESFEDDARNKRLGLEHKESDSIHVIRQKLIKNIELGNLENTRNYIKTHDIKEFNFVSNGASPLPHAASMNKLELVKFFIDEMKVSIDITDEFGNTALINASNKGNLEIINYLIEIGADINHQNERGTTAIMKAAEKNNYHAVKLLLDGNNIDLAKSDYTGRTLKDIAENSRDARILKLLN